MKTAQAAIDIINSKGGILGRPVQTIQCNDESNPTRVGACLQQLIGGGAVFFLEFTGSPAVIQSKAIIQQLRIPTLAPNNATASVPAPPNNDYIYTIGESTTAWGPVYCNGMQNAGIKTLAVLLDNSPTIATFTPALLGAMDCVKSVNKQTAPVNATDISAEIARLANPSADAILISSASVGFEILAHNQIAQQFPKATVFDVATLCNSPTNWKLANPGTLVGSICMGSMDPNNPETQRVQKLLQKSMGSSFQLDQFTAEAWDGVNMMNMAITKAGTTDGPAVNAALQTLTNVTSAYGYKGFHLSLSATKHNAPDGPCGLVLVQYGPTNTQQHPWDKFKPNC